MIHFYSPEQIHGVLAFFRLSVHVIAPSAWQKREYCSKRSWNKSVYEKDVWRHVKYKGTLSLEKGWPQENITGVCKIIRSLKWDISGTHHFNHFIMSSTIKKLDQLTEGESIVGYQIQGYHLSLLKYWRCRSLGMRMKNQGSSSAHLSCSFILSLSIPC